MAERATNSLIASMNKDFDWRRPTFGMIFGMSLVVVRLISHSTINHDIYIYILYMYGLIMIINLTYIFETNFKLNQASYKHKERKKKFMLGCLFHDLFYQMN